MFELISFGYVHNEAEEGRNQPPVADITIDLRQHIRDTGSDSVALVEATAGTLTAFAGCSPRPVTVAIGGATGQRTAPAFVTLLSDRLTAGGHTTNVHHRDLAVSL
ncbi:ATPase [Streptomyces sp. NPDC057909]|uniref:ATPase n=1 Tax=Streptomyces sp. NPDC057909 TaxID=3346277 RepID=UPI0036E01D8F